MMFVALCDHIPTSLTPYLPQLLHLERVVHDGSHLVLLLLLDAEERVLAHLDRDVLGGHGRGGKGNSGDLCLHPAGRTDVYGRSREND